MCVAVGEAIDPVLGVGREVEVGVGVLELDDGIFAATPEADGVSRY